MVKGNVMFEFRAKKVAVQGMEEATSLMRWLSFYAATEQEDCVSIVRRLLSTAFPAVFEEEKEKNGWKAVVATLECFYETSVAVDVERLEEARIELNGTLQTVLELVLGAVVQCVEKEKFVKDILTMEDSVQADLMGTIERVMAKGVSVVEESKEERVEAVAEEQVKENEEKKQSSEKQSPGIGSPLYLSRNATLERTKRENGVLTEENVHLARELENATKRFREVEDEKEKLVEMVRQLMVQLDSDVLRKERSVHALYDERLQALQRELDGAKVDLQAKAALASKVPALHDEVDLLRPLAEKMAKMDATVTKYKTKIDELSGAKDTLRVRRTTGSTICAPKVFSDVIMQRLEGTNAELVEKNLALERELVRASLWHRKLKEAKEANTAVEFRISELETLLARERQELAVTRADMQSVHSALQETKALNAQLQESVDQRGSNDSSQDCVALPMTGGISEFNPELMQKITRLEFENVELKKQVDGETAARIDGLLDEIADISRLKKSFETKYFDTRQALQSTESELEHTKHTFDTKVAEFQARIDQLEEWQACLQDDVLASSLERQLLVSTRDDLAIKLAESTEQENHLSQTATTQGRELAKMQQANEILASRNDQLLQHLECISLAKEELATRLELATQTFDEQLTRQIECSSMQMEGADAEHLRFKQEKARELKEACQQYEELAADTVARMTLLVDTKSSEIVQLTSRLQQDKDKHDAERQELDAANLATTKELERYQELHSVSNADWSEKEQEFNDRVKGLQELCRQSKLHEEELKSTVKSQLQSNARIVEKNKALKADVVGKREAMAKLEATSTRLESKVALLEKELDHFSTHEEQKRDAESGISSFSSQLSTQVSLVVAELEKVLKENKELHQQHARCRCGHESIPGAAASDSGQKTKNYYLSRIQQLEHDKQQVEHKRRELLLVNAKLIQEQKQLRVKNASLVSEVHGLEESVNHWCLHEERRKKKEKQPTLPVETEYKFTSPRIKRVRAKDQARENESLAKPDHRSDTAEHQKPSHEMPVAAPASISTANTNIRNPLDDQDNIARPSTRKRKLDPTAPEAARSTSETTSTANSNLAEASAVPASRSNASSEPRSKSHLITRNLASKKQQPDKPSECQQQ